MLSSDAFDPTQYRPARPDELLARDQAEPSPDGQTDAPRFRTVSLIEFVNATLPERVALLAPWLCAQGLAQVHAWRGTGKTHFSLSRAAMTRNPCTFAPERRFPWLTRVPYRSNFPLPRVDANSRLPDCEKIIRRTPGSTDAVPRRISTASARSHRAALRVHQS